MDSTNTRPHLELATDGAELKVGLGLSTRQQGASVLRQNDLRSRKDLLTFKRLGTSRKLSCGKQKGSDSGKECLPLLACAQALMGRPGVSGSLEGLSEGSLSMDFLNSEEGRHQDALLHLPSSMAVGTCLSLVRNCQYWLHVTLLLLPEGMILDIKNSRDSIKREQKQGETIS